MIANVIVFGIAFGGLVLSIYMMIRNNQVANLRKKVIHEIHSLSSVKKSLKMYEKYNSITYRQMMNPFKSLNKFEKEWRKILGLGEMK